MADQDLVKFVATARLKGASNDKIRNTLISKGWDPKAVDEVVGGSGASSSSNSTIIFVGVGIALFLMFLAVIGVLLIGSGSTEEVECDSDGDCRSGYECYRNECFEEEEGDVEVESGEEEDEVEEDTNSEEIDEEEEGDSDEGDSEQTEESTSSTSEAPSEEYVLEDYNLSYYDVSSFDKETLTSNFIVGYVAAEEDEETTQDVYVSCGMGFTDGETIEEFAGIIQHAIVNLTEDVSCEFNSTLIYENLVNGSMTEVDVTLDYSIDLDEAYEEQDETNNYYTLDVTYDLDSFGEVSCSTEEECSGFACDSEILCYSSCFDEDGNDEDSYCANGYACTEGVCDAVESCSVDGCDTGEYCDSDTDECMELTQCLSVDDCAGYSCDTYCELDCLDADGNDDDGMCATDYECTSGTCVLVADTGSEVSCADESACSGYSCNSESVCEVSCYDENGESDGGLCAENYHCLSGVCEELLCEDDSGYDLFTAGTVEGYSYEDHGEFISTSDYCDEDGELVEYHCITTQGDVFNADNEDAYNYVYWVMPGCTEGYECFEGLCRESTEEESTDEDDNEEETDDEDDTDDDDDGMGIKITDTGPLSAVKLTVIDTIITSTEITAELPNTNVGTVTIGAPEDEKNVFQKIVDFIYKVPTKKISRYFD